MMQTRGIEGTTQHPHQWAANAETPDLMTVFTDAIGEAQKVFSETRARRAPDVAAAFDAVFEWAMRQRFDDDYAERVRRQAWGDRETQ